MLILGRREGDSILIDGGIRIVVVSCDRGGVRIGIEAPSDVKILRGEIAQQVAQENQRAAGTPVAGDWLATLGGPVVAVTPSTSATPAPAPASEAQS
jgi:carbon storage regulator